MKKTTSIILSLFLLGCSQTETKKDSVSSFSSTVDTVAEKPEGKNTKFEIEFVGSNSFFKNDTTYFKLLPHDNASVSLMPKTPGIWLTYGQGTYVAFTKDLDSIKVQIIEKNTATNQYLDTTIFWFKSIEK